MLIPYNFPLILIDDQESINYLFDEGINIEDSYSVKKEFFL